MSASESGVDFRSEFNREDSAIVVAVVPLAVH